MRAFRRCGTVHFGTGHSGTVHLGTVPDTAHWGTVRSGNDLLGIAAGIHNTAAGRRACSWHTWGSCAGDDDVAAAGTGEQREEAASDESLRDRRPYRRREHLQLLPVYSAQPADGGYSSCRLGG